METRIIIKSINVGNDTQHMTSLEIAELTGKQHKDVLKAIRNMEPAWEKITGRNFALCEKYYPMANGVMKKQPYYSLTKTECLYIATKFNDEVRLRGQRQFYLGGVHQVRTGRLERAPTAVALPAQASRWTTSLCCEDGSWRSWHSRQDGFRTVSGNIWRNRTDWRSPPYSQSRSPCSDLRTTVGRRA